MKRAVISPKILLLSITGDPQAPPATLINAAHNHILEIVACPNLITQVHKKLQNTNLLKHPHHPSRIPPDAAPTTITHPNPPTNPPHDTLTTLAHTTNADYIITTNQQLLTHITPHPPHIIHPHNACELLKLTEPD